MKADNTYALITGSSSGIGKAIAIECASRGMNVLLIAYHNEDDLKALTEKFRNEQKVKADYLICDLTDDDAPEKVHDWCKENNYELHMLVNNAGLGTLGEFSKSSTQITRDMIDLNVRAVALLTQLFIPSLLKSKRGYILNIGSIASFQPIPYKIVYSATKWFIRSFSLALREELRGTGVSVTMIAPGGVPTNEKVKKRIANHGWIGRVSMLEADVVAKKAIKATLKGKPILIPGKIDRFLMFMSSLVPVTFSTKQVGKRFKGEDDD